MHAGFQVKARATHPAAQDLATLPAAVEGECGTMGVTEARACDGGPDSAPGKAAELQL